MYNKYIQDQINFLLSHSITFSTPIIHIEIGHNAIVYAYLTDNSYLTMKGVNEGVIGEVRDSTWN